MAGEPGLIIADERNKYDAIWQLPEYYAFSPSEQFTELFAEISGIKKGTKVIELGCGHGRAGLQLAEKFGADMTFLDISHLPHDDKLIGCEGGFPFIHTSLWQNWGGNKVWDIGYCCDVMEHIPPEYSMAVVAQIMRRCKAAFFSIAFFHDGFGAYINKPLHMNVQNFVWWRDRLREFGKLTEARDRMSDGIFYLERF